MFSHKKKEIQPFVTAWMKSQSLCEIKEVKQRKTNTPWFQLYVEFGGGKVELIEPMSGMVVCQGHTLKKHMIISIDGRKHLITVNIC